jgi:hypothetical protein
MKTNLLEQSWCNAWIVTSAARPLHALISSKRFTIAIHVQKYTVVQIAVGFVLTNRQHVKNLVKSSQIEVSRGRM